MATPIKSPMPKESQGPVGPMLQDSLNSTYGLYLATHNYHWNVEGGSFGPLHKLFEEQYNDLFMAVDAIAERIRALGNYVQPLDRDSFSQLSKRVPNPLTKGANAMEHADQMVQNLITLGEDVIEDCLAVKKAAQKAEDDESENLMVERITAHQKALWMLRSILK